MHNRSTSLDSLASTSSSLLHRPGSSVVPTQRKRVLIPFVLLLSIVLAIHFTSSTDSSPASYATGAVEALKGWTGTSTTAPAEVKGEGGGQGSVEVDPLKDVVEEEEVDLDLEEEDVVLEGVEQFEVDWSERERKLRGLKFETSSVDPSLTAVLNELTLNERRTRQWLFSTRPFAQRGTGVGLGASSPPERIHPARGAMKHVGFPLPDEGPNLFEGGSFAKYGELLEEWQTGRQKDMCQGGKWQEDYAKLHNEIIRGQRPTKILESSCSMGKECGGLADRMLGIASAFLFSITSSRAITIEWDHPVPFDLIFDARNVDWSHPFRGGSAAPESIFSNKTLETLKTSVEAHNMPPEGLDRFWESFAKTYEKDPWVALERPNRGAVFRSFSYPNIAPQLSSLGFHMTTSYTCLFSYLLTPKPSSLTFINAYTSLFSLPSIYSIGIQIRTGDKYLRDASLDKQVNTVERYSHYFDCANQVAETYATEGQKVVWYLITDSKSLREDAVKKYPGKAVISGLVQRHNEIGGKEGLREEAEKAKSGEIDLEETRGEVRGLLNTVEETWSFAGTDFQLLTAGSGFGRIPTWMRGRPGSTISVPRLIVRGEKVIAPKLDCRLDSTLASFSDLASAWSMG